MAVGEVTVERQSLVLSEYLARAHDERLKAIRAAEAAAAADPTNAELQATAAKAAATVETVFKGQSLRGMLLNAYAFWQLGQIALISAGVALVGAILMLLLSIAGLIHLRRTPLDATI